MTKYIVKGCTFYECFKQWLFAIYCAVNKVGCN